MYKTKWLITSKGRECSKCGVFQLWEVFSKNKHGTRGRQSWCVNCFREYRGSQKQKEYLITDQGRECSKCGVFKLWSEFHVRSDLSTGRCSACKACMIIKRRMEYTEGRGRDAELRRKYGIGLNKYETLIEEQDGKCAICGATETSIRKNGRVLYLSVDHNHQTGQVRGLLCQRCNAILGMAIDDVAILEKAILYLKNHGG